MELVEDGIGSSLREALVARLGVNVEPGSNGRDPGRFTLELNGCQYRVTREGQRKLTPRETDVVERVMRGWSNKVIAYDLGIAHATVRVLLHRVMHKMGVASRVELEKKLPPLVPIEPPHVDDVAQPTTVACEAPAVECLPVSSSNVTA
jgi:DNA-binding CsgD family transcriptional regulator